ncbi:MAG: exodeoxyribonuclease V subunit gamma [Deltaproteobacteria bacterium]|jgi:exodeoxyribonuclease V gamma subunit|nr:exodeoxyribonuclease V subunit gamma [Deltaproteobacteria bacterium]
MPSFNLYTSNRQETLIEHLGEKVLQMPLVNPLATELIVVQHPGIQRWISHQLTLKNGISANTRFLFPNELLQMAYKEVIPDYKNIWDTDQLQWYLFDQLLSIPDEPEFKLLKGYQDINKELKSFQLAAQLSHLFDQYDMFRPGIMEAWEDGEDNVWQAKLYRSLPIEVRSKRKYMVQEQFKDNLNKIQMPLIKIPERISFFGISYLPPLHLDVLAGLSRLIDIHFYHLNPSPLFWGDLFSEKRMMKELLKKSETPTHDQYFPEANSLLASWGEYGQEFCNSLINLRIVNEKEMFNNQDSSLNESERITLLSSIQKDIFYLKNPENNSETEKILIAEDDYSIQFHSCHSPMREIEVLKDALLKIFSNDDINPENVLVMTPDIDHYAPLIQAVFPKDPNEKNYIPYSITDRVFVKESVVIQYFLKLFEVVQGRFTLIDIFSLMASRAIKEKFQLTDNDLNLIKEWLEAVNVRWGIDGEFREKKGVPNTYENTWQYGIDRIVTGFGMPGLDHHLLRENSSRHDILPFDHIEGNNAILFGRFLDYFNILSSMAINGENSIYQQRTLNEWNLYFDWVIESLFKDQADWTNEIHLIRESISRLKNIEIETNFTPKIGIDGLLDFFQSEFNKILNESGFTGQGVTFAAMKPMRSVPFKIIALIGMNDKAFPRIEKNISFNLSGKSKKGDRSVKGEDRYLFLETLISARQTLYLSYIGQSIKDNSLLAPSTLLLELLDYIQTGYLDKSQLKRIVINHPLQAFSPRNFSKQEGFTSFSDQNLAAAGMLKKPNKETRSDFDLKLPVADETFKTISIQQLVNFFDNPIKFLLNHCLKIRLDGEKEAQDENEPFNFDFLSKYSVEGDILNSLNHSIPKGITKRITKSQGLLPHALPGERLFDNTYEELAVFREEIKDYIDQQSNDLYPFEITIDEFTLTGTINTALENHLVRYRHSSVKVKDRMRNWLEHLVINFLKPSGYPTESILIGKESKTGNVEIYHTEPIDNPEIYLKQLLGIYFSGLSQPLAFFPRSADKYMKKYQSTLLKKDEDAALQAGRGSASAIWNGRPGYPGESANGYFQLCFSRKSLFEETDFESNIRTVLFPIYKHQHEVEGD